MIEYYFFFLVSQVRHLYDRQNYRTFRYLPLRFSMTKLLDIRFVSFLKIKVYNYKSKIFVNLLGGKTKTKIYWLLKKNRKAITVYIGKQMHWCGLSNTECCHKHLLRVNARCPGLFQITQNTNIRPTRLVLLLWQNENNRCRHNNKWMCDPRTQTYFGSFGIRMKKTNYNLLRSWKKMQSFFSY